MPKITPSEAKNINNRLLEHFETHKDHKFCAVTPDGQIFHADEDSKDKTIAAHGKKGLHNAQNYAAQNGFDSVIIVGRNQKIEANAEEPKEVTITKVETKTFSEEEIQAAAALKGAKLTAKDIVDLVKKKNFAGAFEIIGKTDQATLELVKEQLSATVKKTLETEAAKAQTAKAEEEKK